MSITNHGDIQQLRKQLFESMARLSVGTASADEIARARAIAETAQTLINSAKVEVDFLKVTGGQGGSGFIPLAPAEGGTGNAPADTTTVVKPGVRITQHRLRG